MSCLFTNSPYLRNCAFENFGSINFKIIYYLMLWGVKNIIKLPNMTQYNTTGSEILRKGRFPTETTQTDSYQFLSATVFAYL